MKEFRNHDTADTQPRSIINLIGLIFAVLISLIIANGIFQLYMETNKEFARINEDLESKIEIAETILSNEMEKLEVVAGIVKGQQLKLVDFMDYDRVRPIKLLLQTISSKHNVEMLFLFDEFKNLLASNSFQEENKNPELYKALLRESRRQTNIVEIPAAILENKFPFDTVPTRSDSLLCMTTTVRLIHDLGNVYGYVVLVKPLSGNKMISRKMAEMTQADIVIYDRQGRAILTSFENPDVSRTESNLLFHMGKNHFIRMHNLPGDIGKLAVALDSSSYEEERNRLLLNTLLPSLFTIIISLLLFVLLKTRIIDKVNELSRLLRSLTGNDLDLGTRLQTNIGQKGRPDEVELMCRDFNSLMDLLESTFYQTQDQSEQLKKQTEKILTLYKQNKMILNAAGEGIYGVNMQGDTTFVNQAALDLTGFTRYELLGNNQHELIHHTHKDGTPYPYEQCPIYRCIIEGKAITVEEEIFWRKDGTSFPVELNTSPIMEKGDILGAVVVFRDISERNIMEREKTSMREQLLQSQKMEAVGTLAGGVAHDINNMLTAIQGYTDLISMFSGESNTKVKTYLEKISSVTSRAGALTKQLLLFSRRQPMEYDTINLNRVIDDMVNMLNRLIGENITITTNLAEDLHLIVGDKNNIEQIVMNFTVNAKDALPEGGAITISTENVEIDDECCKHFPMSCPGNFVRLAVQDNGVGMQKSTISHIFDPFFTTKETGKGTGLGLSVVYGIVQQHKGWINVESKPDDGSRFEVFLPAADSAVAIEPEGHVSIEDLQGDGRKILLVEDDPGVREIAVAGLSESGYRVTACENAAEALEIFRSKDHEFALLFSDVVLPDKNGVQLAENMRAMQPDLPILLTSGYTNVQSEWEIIQEREYRFVQKPYEIITLLRVIKSILTPKTDPAA